MKTKTAQHTPGPWLYIKHDTLKDSHEIANTTGYERKTIAVGVSQANARLISVAPDLLRVLTRLHAAVSARMGADEPTGEQRLELLKAWEEAGSLLSPNKSRFIIETKEGGAVLSTAPILPDEDDDFREARR